MKKDFLSHIRDFYLTICFIFIYIAPVKRSAIAGGSVRQYHRRNTEQSSKTQGTLVRGEIKQEGKPENVKTQKVHIKRYK